MTKQSGSLVLGIDLEGVNEDLIHSGLNLEVDRVTEIGAVMWDWELGQPIEFINHLIDEPDRLGIDQELAELTGITEAMLTDYGHKKEDIPTLLESFAKKMEQADYIMAHNLEVYDRPMLQHLFQRHNREMPQKVWIDTATDIEYPRQVKHLSMASLEHWHGFINPFPHRALTDVLAMFKIATRYELGRMARLAQSEKVKIVAHMEVPDWKNKEEVAAFDKLKTRVSKSGFRWNPKTKQWWRKVHQVLLDEGKIQYGFDWFISNDSGNEK